jgi:uncharacterized membrane protein
MKKNILGALLLITLSAVVANFVSPHLLSPISGTKIVMFLVLAFGGFFLLHGLLAFLFGEKYENSKNLSEIIITAGVVSLVVVIVMSLFSAVFDGHSMSYDDSGSESYGKYGREE